MEFFKKILSFKNEYRKNKKYKVISILGIKLKFCIDNNYNTEYHQIFTEQLYNICKNLDHEKKQLQILCNQNLIKDHKFPIGNILMYLPDYPLDFIQRKIVENGNFYEIKDLEFLDNYLDNNSIILDIGANIGNHTVYWGKVSNVQRIYSFEPIKSTFEKLNMNVQINGLQNKVNIFNFGIGESCSKSNILSYDEANCGASVLKLDEEGDIEIKNIDSLDIQESHISLIKIDTEGFELDVLKGALNTIKKYKPTIYVEIEKENFENVNNFLESLNYKKEKQVKRTNYLYIHKSKK